MDSVAVGITGHWEEGSYYSDSNEKLKDKEFKTEEEVKAAGGNRPYFYAKNHYLIARWGDEKKSWDQLRQQAIERFIGSQRQHNEEIIKKAKRELEDLQDKAVQRFGIK